MGTTPIQYQQLVNLDEIGWNCVEIHELISLLAGKPPMMPIFIDDTDTETIKVINDIRIDNSGLSPVLMLFVSEKPQSMTVPAQTVEEGEARKKQLAMQMENNSKKASEMPEIVE